jgi:hypothetical protein
MTERLDAELTIRLKRDEAIVLFWYLGRHLYSEDGARLRATFDHPAEELALGELFHEMIPQLSGPATPEYDAEYRAAIEHLAARFR